MWHYIGSDQQMVARAWRDARELGQVRTSFQASPVGRGRGSWRGDHSERSGGSVKRRWRRQMERHERATSRPSPKPSRPGPPRSGAPRQAVDAAFPASEPPCPVSLQLARLAESMKRTRESRRRLLLQRALHFTPEQRRRLAAAKIELRRRQIEALSGEIRDAQGSAFGPSPVWSGSSCSGDSTLSAPDPVGSRSLQE